MSTPLPDQIESVVAEIIKESLVAREPAHVPGLGTFEVRHHPSSRVRTESGEQRFVPPRDEVVFIPEQDASDHVRQDP